MPELAELRMTADVINAVSENREFYNIQKNGQHKCPDLETPFKKFTISAESKGKELQLTLKDVKFPIVKKLMMGMGMTGGFMSIEKGEEIPKKVRLYFESDDLLLCFVDQRKFGNWKWGDWNKDRSPDPTKEFVNL